MGISDTGIDGQREFPDTAWSSLRELKDPDSPEYGRHIQRLVETYWRPVYWVIRRTWSVDPQEAKDLTQDFFTQTVLEGGLLRTFAPERGSFRGYLRGAIAHFLTNHVRVNRAQKRGGRVTIVSLNVDADPEALAADLPSGSATPDEIFDAAWNSVVIAEALRVLEQRLVASGKTVELELFKRYDLDLDRKDLSYADLGAGYGLSADKVKHALMHARATLRDVVMEIVRGYVQRPDDLQAEVRQLLG